ncbi:MAG TPA: cytochrome c oxidase subunit II [Gemmatimonadales bacterium]|nr:cytochrome c oxidase subunit II [Gemmatimonadales bacterium]
MTRAAGRSAAIGTAAFAVTGCAAAPSVFDTHGTIANRVAPLGWYLIIMSLVVMGVIIVLVLMALFRGRPPRDTETIELAEPRSGLGWILWGGIIIPAIVLAFSFVFSLVTLSATARPPVRPGLTVAITGHRWWWEVKYLDPDGKPVIITANEIHVPVGRPVRVELTSDNVIHSFWVPELAGKTDVIPGQQNVAWLEATTPGRFHGQCAEYCGLQHAHMQLVVEADPPAEFDHWMAGQRQPAAEPTTSLDSLGQRTFVGQACSLCHTIQGTAAHGRVGPDLTHLASRQTIAAGTLPNTRGNLAGWISNTQTIKPGNLMPTMYLHPAELQSIVAYLETLK